MQKTENSIRVVEFLVYFLCTRTLPLLPIHYYSSKKEKIKRHAENSKGVLTMLKKDLVKEKVRIFGQGSE
jgi:hypothetical protein